MEHLSVESDVESTLRRQSWFVRPLSNWWCVLGWCVASGLFIAIVSQAGGVAVGDAFEHIYPTWTVAHGQLSCMYPPHDPQTIIAFASPFYPLFAGGVGAVFQIGHAAPFPSDAAMGPNCAHAVPAMIHWAEKGSALWPTLRTGYAAWFFLMIGAIMLLRASGRGRSGWEPTALVILACLPPVWMCVEMYSHPQDIVAMGFGLGAMACALRDRWVAAGILVALGVLTQQYALLVAIPLLVLAPTRRWVPYGGAAVATVAVMAVPLLVLSHGSAGRWIFVGSGNAVIAGTTVLWVIHIKATLLIALSRIAPLVLSALLAWFVRRRLGAAALQPSVLVSVVAVSLALRLVFEDNLFAYYFLALAVSLVLFDVIRGRIRETLVAWLAMVSLVYSESFIIVWRQTWGQDARRWLPTVVMVVALLMIVRAVLAHRVGWNVVMWAATVVTTLVIWPVSSDPLQSQPPLWVWQLVLVPSGLALAGWPLWARLHATTRPATPEALDQPAPAG